MVPSSAGVQNVHAIQSFHADELLSAAPTKFTAPLRLDPYWDRIWLAGSTVTWRSYDTAEAHVIAGLGGLPAAVRNMTEAEAWDVLESTRNRQALLRFLATLTMWRTLTAEQMEAFTGLRGTSKLSSRLIVAAFRVGILDFGSPAAGLMREATSNRGTLYRPNPGNAVQRILRVLATAEWTSLTGGQGWDQGGQFDRHNVLATELALRIAEYNDVATVLGEKLSRIDLLAYSGIGQTTPKGETRSADLTVIRNDGLKIAIEVTASTSKHFQLKVDRWAKLLNDRPMNTSGLAVVFLIAPPQGASEASVRKATYNAVASAVRRYPGTAFESIATRIGIARWTGWFPARHHLSESFFPLTVDMSDGMRQGSMTWRKVHLLNEATYTFSPFDPGLQAILSQSHLLWGAPVWLRDFRRAPVLIPSLDNDGGLLNMDLPTPPPKRPSRSKPRPVGVSNARVSLANLPRRMRPYM